MSVRDRLPEENAAAGFDNIGTALDLSPTHLLRSQSANPKADADRLIRAVLPKAFRRPMPADVQQRYLGRVHATLDAGCTFFDAMTYGYKLIVSSPHFLLLPEGGTIDPKLDGHALAARLAYFLWSGPPDAELLAATAKGELTSPRGAPRPDATTASRA